MKRRALYINVRNRSVETFFLALIMLFCKSVQAQVITTIAGTGTVGHTGDGGAAILAQVNIPSCIAVDKKDNIYFGEVPVNKLRKISTAGIITTIAGTGTSTYNGDNIPATAANLGPTFAIATDTIGNIYLADGYNYRIRKINTAGIITTIAGNGIPGYNGEGIAATAAGINQVSAIAIDPQGNIYYAEGRIQSVSTSYRIRKINAAGIVTTLAGSATTGYTGNGGPATAAKIGTAYGLVVDTAGQVYFTEYENGAVRKIDKTGIISTVAGIGTSAGITGDGGPATAAKLGTAYGMTMDDSGNLFIAVNLITRKVNTAGIISTIAGQGTSYNVDGVAATAAQLDPTQGIAADSRHNLYITQRATIRMMYNNSLPHYTAGTDYSIAMCQNSAPVPISASLKVFDTNSRQQITWSLATAPLHGTASVGLTIASTGDTVFPTGQTYTPATGYTGNDTFQVRVTDQMSSDTISVYVTVHPLPEILPVGTICIGATKVLSDPIGGGAWGSSNTNIATMTANTVYGVNAGTATITYMPITGCMTTTTVTVAAPPGAIMGATVVCEASAITLSNATGGGTWSSSTMSIATISAGGVVGGILQGTATISYTITASGCMVNKTITVQPLPLAITGSGGVCTGGTTILSNATAGGTWTINSTPAATLAGSTVSGYMVGTAVVTYTLPTACNVSKIIAVNPLPALTTVAGVICVGTATALSNATAGGIWTTGNTTIATAGAGTITGATAGTTTMTYTLPTGCTSVTTVTVSTTPVAITGPTAVCEGASVTLSDATAGGAWSSSSTIVASVTAGVVRGLTSGNTIISYTLANSCMATKLLTVHAMPLTIILGKTSICPGEFTVLSDATPGGIWSSGSTDVAITSSGLATGAIAIGVMGGTAVISYIMPSGCTATAVLTVNPLPAVITGIPTVCEHTTTTLSSASAGGTWSVGNTTVATASSGVVTGVAAGTTLISYVLPTGCMRTATVSVLPGPGAIVGAGAVCNGTTTTLSNATAGGVWSTPPVRILAVNPVSGVVNAIGPGTGVITYTVGSCTAELTMTVHALPWVYTVTGGGTRCMRAPALNIDLSGSESGVSYTLYNGTTPISVFTGTGALLSTKATAAGTYTIQAANITTGCSVGMTSAAYIYIDKGILPAINIMHSTGDTVCKGDAVMLTTVTANGGLTPVYTWMVNGVAVSHAPTYSYVPADDDMVSVEMTSSELCATPEKAYGFVRMTVREQTDPAAILTVYPGTNVAAGENVLFTVSVPNAISTPSYEWRVNGVLIKGETEMNYISNAIKDKDIVSCRVITNGICKRDSTVSIAMNVSPLGIISTAKEQRLSVFPNPNRGTFVISGRVEEDMPVVIYNMLGQEVYRTIIEKGSVNRQVQMGSDIPNGVYQLSMSGSNGRVVALVVNR